MLKNTKTHFYLGFVEKGEDFHRWWEFLKKFEADWRAGVIFKKNFFESHTAVAAANTQEYLNESSFSHWQTLGCPCFPTGTVSGILGGGCPG